MTKLVAYIFSFYILLSAVIPCSVFDNCEDEERKEQDSSKHKGDCNNCSPFSICSSTFIYNLPNITLDPLDLKDLPNYGEYCFPNIAEYLSTFFQPPRSA